MSSDPSSLKLMDLLAPVYAVLPQTVKTDIRETVAGLEARKGIKEPAYKLVRLSLDYLHQTCTIFPISIQILMRHSFLVKLMVEQAMLSTFNTADTCMIASFNCLLTSPA